MVYRGLLGFYNCYLRVDTTVLHWKGQDCAASLWEVVRGMYYLGATVLLPKNAGGLSEIRVPAYEILGRNCVVIQKPPKATRTAFSTYSVTGDSP
jgi:hypothetical protein